MATDFSEVALSRKELKALRLLNKHNLIAEENEASDTVKRLIQHDLAEYFHTTYNGKPRIGVHLTGKGKDYLMYIKRGKKSERIQSRRYWITTAIAVLALVLAGISLAAQLHLIQLPGA